MPSLKVTEQMLLLDLGEVRRLVTQDGPRLARFIAVMRGSGATCIRFGRSAVGSRLMRSGVPPSQALVYTLAADPFEFEQEGSSVCLPGLRLYLERAPEFVETPYYAWVEPARSGVVED